MWGVLKKMARCAYKIGPPHLQIRGDALGGVSFNMWDGGGVSKNSVFARTSMIDDMNP